MRLTPRCYAVPGLAYLRPLMVNAGFIAGYEVTLIVDTGPNAQAASVIEGYARAVRPANDLMALNTEPHFDHIGGNAHMIACGMRVYGHESIHRTPGEFAAELAGLGDAAPAFFANTSLANPTYSVRDDMQLDLGRCAVEVLLTPGHTPSNISVYVPSDGVLYSGDCLVNGFALNLASGDARQWLASLDRIERLGPRVIVPGHGPVAQGDEVGTLIARVRTELTLGVA